MKRAYCTIALFVGAVLLSTAWAKVPESAFTKNPYPKEKGPVKVFILAGQSNMQGHAALRTLEYLVYHPDTAKDYEHLKDRWGDWVPRNDVWVWTTDGERFGSLRPGFGANQWQVGPELGFGWTAGEQLDQQVLIIKVCWGGKSVRRDFLSPGSPLPSDDVLQQQLQRAREKNPDITIEDIKERYGHFYRLMLTHVRDVLADPKQFFPDYDEQQGYELAGLVWFQGWNDMVDGEQRSEQYAGYTRRLAQMIRDLRKDLKAPNLPVVIGELGVGGEDGNLEFRAAQRAVAELPEFQGNVKFVETHPFWEPEVEKMVNEGVWQGPDWPRFYNVGSERGYHYLGSGKMMYRIGTAFGQAMLELLNVASVVAPDDQREPGD